jgi:hypothetical protein
LVKLNLKVEQLERIRHLTKVGEGRTCHFLGFTLDLDTTEFCDRLDKTAVHDDMRVKTITVLLAHYSLAKEMSKTGKLVKFKDLPGGYAFERTFTQRVVHPVAQVFGSNPSELVGAANLLGGKRLDYGDVSVEVPALEGIPLVFILWAAREFPPTATLLFDESASCFLDTESLAVLGELTSHRLLDAHSISRLGKTL